MHAHQIPSIEALESDLNRLLETRLVPGAAASHAAIPQLMYLKSRSAPRARTTSQSAANDVTTREAVEQAIEDLGESDDGKVARALFDARGPLGFSARIKNAADALGVNEKTIRRDRQRRALRAVALRMIRSELEFLAAAVSPLVLYGQDPLIRALWSTQADAEIILTGGEIPAAIPHSKGAYSVQAGDVAALLEAYANLVGLRDQASISVAPSSEVHGAKLGCNIVSIGGPRWNVITRNLLELLKPPWRFSSSPDDFGTPRSALVEYGPEQRKLTARTEEGEVLEAHGTIISAPNPHNPRTRVTVLAGLSTLGVLAATRALDPTRLMAGGSLGLKKIHDVYAAQVDTAILQVVVSTQVIEGEVVPVGVSDARLETKRLPTVVRR